MQKPESYYEWIRRIYEIKGEKYHNIIQARYRFQTKGS